MSNNDGDLGSFFQSKKKKGTKKKQAEAPKEVKPQEEVKQEITTSQAEEKKEAPATKKIDSDEAAFMKQTDAYESSDEERAEINIDADSVIKDTKDVEKEKRLAEERETGNKMGWDVIASKGNNANTTNTRAEFGTKKPEQSSAQASSSSGPIQFKRGSGPPTFKKSNAFGNKMEFPTFEGGKGGKSNNQPLQKSNQPDVARSEQSTTGHFGMLAASARQQEAPREERKVQASMPVFKGKAKIGGGAPQVVATTEETKAHNYDTGFMSRNVKSNRDDDDRKKRNFDGKDNSDDEGSRRQNDGDDDFNTVTEKKREFKKGEGYPKQKKQFNDYQNKDEVKSNNFQRGNASNKPEETNEVFGSAPAVKKSAASKPAQLPDKADWSNVFGSN